jgi:hypothetical protein
VIVRTTAIARIIPSVRDFMVSMLLTPVPLSNVAPTMVISLISVDYIEKDGLLLSAAFLAAIGLIRIASAAVWGAITG